MDIGQQELSSCSSSSKNLISAPRARYAFLEHNQLKMTNKSTMNDIMTASLNSCNQAFKIKSDPAIYE